MIKYKIYIGNILVAEVMLSPDWVNQYRYDDCAEHFPIEEFARKYIRTERETQHKVPCITLQ